MTEALTAVDHVDRAILTMLQQDGRMANVDLAEAVHLSPSACLVAKSRTGVSVFAQKVATRSLSSVFSMSVPGGMTTCTVNKSACFAHTPGIASNNLRSWSMRSPMVRP